MEHKIDITIWQYSIGVILLIYNLTLYVAWSIRSGEFKDRRYRRASVTVVMLIVAFIYSMGMGLYARSMQIDVRMEFLDSSFWHWRYTPVLIVFAMSSYRLTKWAIYTIRLCFFRKKHKEDFDRRKNLKGIRKDKR